MLDYQHKHTAWPVRGHDLVAVEACGPNVDAGNQPERRMARFLDLLEYKANLHCTRLVQVEPAGMTEECSECGVETSKPLWIREHSAQGAVTLRTGS
ncbi:MAG: hypothetical protein J07HQX50_01960 [Haloquadratum sp. J07HQX50]|nr:MAG: hypothetical protein J07HQX50_01960 [Haloquadratum sp. J07HQX50]